MSRIDKLAISGIRNFGEAPPEIIDFNTPLTLIVGYNGSGKTTIIECLKYATTGLLPPNTGKGAAFIHDPKLTGEKEVKAQVRLGFRSVAGHQMTATRNLQVSSKKAGAAPSMSTTDCTLLIRKDGERTVVSSKVADMNALLPQYIGVSQAVLDNVIFCHQEDSLWPISEPGHLKKKFDEIFEALKWTNAMKNINDLQKSHKGELGKYQVREELEKGNKDRGDRAQMRSEKLAAEIDKLHLDYEVLLRDIKTALQIKQERWKQAQKAFGIVDQLKTKQQRADNLQENIDNLKPNLDELHESDEWLQSTLARFDEKVGEYEEKKASLLEQHQRLQKSLSTSRSQLSIKLAELGRRQSDKKTFENQVKDREESVRTAASDHSLRGYEGDLDEHQIQDFVDRIRKLSREKDTELERIKKASEEAQNQIQTKLTELDNRQTVLTQDKMTARQNINENDKNCQKKQREANAINMDDARKAELDKSKLSAQKRLSDLNADFDAADWDKRITAESNQQLEAESERQRLMDELKLNNKFASDRAQLDWVKKQAQETRDQLQTLKLTYRTQLNSIIGSDWDWADLTQEFQTVMEQREDSVAEAKRAQELADMQLRDADFKLKQARTIIAQKKEESLKRQSIIVNSIVLDNDEILGGPDDYLRELELLQEYHDGMQKKLEECVAVSSYYLESRDMAVKNNACRLCERAFSDKKERSSAVDKINRELEKHKRDYLEGKMMEIKQDLSTALAARSDYESYKTLSAEISGLEKQVKDAENSRLSFVKAAESEDDHVRRAAAALSDVESLAAIVKTTNDCISGIAKHEAEISGLTSQQKLSGSSMTAAEIDEQQAACEDLLRSLRARIDKMVNNKHLAKSAITNLEKDLTNISSTLNTANHQLEKKQSLLADIDDIRKRSKSSENTIQEADSDLEKLVPKISAAKLELEKVRQDGRVKEKKIQGEKDKLAATVNRFKMIDQAINKYVEDGGAAHLATCEQAIKTIEQEQKNVDDDINRVNANIDEVKKKLDDSDRTRRSIIDNIQHRKYCRDLSEVNKEISDLKSRNVTDDYHQLERQATKADEQYSILDIKRASMLATVNGKDAELAEAIQLWDTDYKDAAANYREARIKVETTKAAIEDLGKYSKALEAAIMKYHSVKMEEINQIAGELWRQTYQGSDVDTIMIKSENENATSKRAYNYRVVMVKSNAEMDMRGRCSAGQKVLASIVIRLALAECFGVNCGIIALDEPTTNLDEDNIKALAISLHSIIKTRRAQANFQLIIITHDETFLREMKCQDFCDIYFRVSRNEKQKSIITEQKVTDVIY